MMFDNILESSWLISCVYLFILYTILVVMTRYYFLRILKNVQSGIRVTSGIRRSVIQAVFASVPLLSGAVVNLNKGRSYTDRVLAESSLLGSYLGLTGILSTVTGSLKLQLNQANKLHAVSIIMAVASCLRQTSALLAPLFFILAAALSAPLIRSVLRLNNAPVYDIHYQYRKGNLYVLEFFRPIFFPVELICDNLIIIFGHKSKPYVIGFSKRVFLSPLVNGLFLIAYLKFQMENVPSLTILIVAALGGFLLYFCSRHTSRQKFITLYSLAITISYMYVLIAEIGTISGFLVSSHRISPEASSALILVPATTLSSSIIHWYFCTAGFKSISYYSTLFSVMAVQFSVGLWTSLLTFSSTMKVEVPQKALLLPVVCLILLHLTLLLYLNVFKGRLLKDIVKVLVLEASIYYTGVAALLRPSWLQAILNYDLRKSARSLLTYFC